MTIVVVVIVNQKIILLVIINSSFCGLWLFRHTHNIILVTSLLLLYSGILRWNSRTEYFFRTSKHSDKDTWKFIIFSGQLFYRLNNANQNSNKKIYQVFKSHLSELVGWSVRKVFCSVLKKISGNFCELTTID